MLPLDREAALAKVAGMATQISQEGLALIASFEGFSPYLYDDPAGHATVGYGFLVHLGNYHRQRGVCPKCDQWARIGETALYLSPEKGRELLREKAQPYTEAVVRTTRPMNQHELDALSSFCFNVGPGGYINSSVRQAVNTNGDVCAALRRYVTGVGFPYPLPGLVRRREAECAMFYDTSPIEEEDEMAVRYPPSLHESGVGKWPTNQTLAPQAQDYIQQIGVDWPLLPASAKAIDLEVAIDPATAGTLTYKDGDGRYAGEFSKQYHRGRVRVYPKDRTARIFVAGAPVRVISVRLLEYVP